MANEALGNIMSRLSGLKSASGRRVMDQPEFLQNLQEEDTDVSGTSQPLPNFSNFQTPQSNLPESDLGERRPECARILPSPKLMALESILGPISLHRAQWVTVFLDTIPRRAGSGTGYLGLARIWRPLHPAGQPPRLTRQKPGRLAVSPTVVDTVIRAFPRPAARQLECSAASGLAAK